MSCIKLSGHVNSAYSEMCEKRAEKMGPAILQTGHNVIQEQQCSEWRRRDDGAAAAGAATN